MRAQPLACDPLRELRALLTGRLGARFVEWTAGRARAAPVGAAAGHESVLRIRAPAGLLVDVIRNFDDADQRVEVVIDRRAVTLRVRQVAAMAVRSVLEHEVVAATVPTQRPGCA